jgi:hypothetical protein
MDCLLEDSTVVVNMLPLTLPLVLDIQAGKMSV